MAVTDQQKLDFLLKKIGYTKTKTGSTVGTGAISGTPKQPFAEAIPSPLVVANSSLWNEADSIPATPPGSDTVQVKVYSTTSALRMTADATSSGQRAYIAYTTYNDTSSTRLTNWIDTQFGSGYLIKVYKGDPNSGGAPLSAGATDENWFFDYSAGVLNFNDDDVPSGVTDTNIYIVGYRYIGQTGAPTSGISTFSYLDLTVERNLDVGVQGGISTFRNNIDLNADLDVDGHTNLDNVSVAGVSTFASNIIANGSVDLAGDIDVDGHTNLDNVNIVGVATVTGNIIATGEIQCKDISLIDTTPKITFFDTDNNPDYTISANSGSWRVTDSTSSAERLVVNSDGHVDVLGNLDVGAGIDVTGNVIASGNIDANGDLDVDGHTNLDNVSVAGVTTTAGLLDINAGGQANTFKVEDLTDNRIVIAGTGGELEDSANLTFNGTTLGVTGDATFSGNVSIGGTLTYEDVINVDSVGIITARAGINVTGGVITALAGENKIPSLYANMAALPAAGSYHGMFAHVHSTGRGYFAHAGNWLELVNADTTGRVGTGTESYFIDRLVSTSTTATSLNVTGVTTAVTVDINGDLDVDGHTNLDNVNIAGIATVGLNLALSSIGDSDINHKSSSNALRLRHNSQTKLAITASSSTFATNIIGQGNLDVDGQTDLDVLNVAELATFSANIDANGDLDVDGHTNLDNVSIAGVSTFAGAIDLNADLDVDGHTNLDNVSVAGVTTMSGDLTISSTAPQIFLTDTNNNSDYKILVQNGAYHIFDVTNSATRIRVDASGRIDLKGNVDCEADLDVDGHTNLDNVSIAGVSTFANAIDLNADLDVDGHTNLDNVSVAGVGTFASSIYVADSIIHQGDTDTKIDFAPNDIRTTVANKLRIHHASNGLNYFNGNNISQATSTHTKLAGSDYVHRFRDEEGDDTLVQFFNTNVKNTVLEWNDYGNTTAAGNLVFKGVGGSGLEHARFTGSGNFNLLRDLDVDGHTNLDNVSIAGVTTFTGTAEFDGTAKFDSTITAGGATGTNGQYLKTTGTGVEWATFPTMRTRQTSTASAGQTTFSFTYTVNFLDVFVNGIKLTDAEFTATNGSSVVLAVGCFVGDIVELVSYNTVSGGGGGGGGSLNNIVEDTTPQLGGNLDLFSKTITGTGGINMTGVVTATSFVGNGSGLTGVVASGTGVVIKNSGSTVGTAGTINFGDNLSVSPASAGIVTITGSAGVTTSQFDVNKLDVSGISTFSGNIDVNADLDVDGHTNLDNVNIAGVTTFRDTSEVHIAGGKIVKSGVSVSIAGTHVSLVNAGNTAFMLQAVQGAWTKLFFNSYEKLVTSNTGISVTGSVVATGADINGDIDVDGHTELDNVNIAGVVTATTFKGALQGTSGTFSSGVDITGDLDVDGHTDLDNVSVAGVVTATSFVGDGSSLTGISGGVTSDAQKNTVAGTDAGSSFSGSNALGNTLVGYHAGKDIDSGDYNTVVGSEAFKVATGAEKNIVLGTLAGPKVTTGSSNLLFGYEVAEELLNGSNNVIVGARAGKNLTSGTTNTIIGNDAGTSGLYGNTTGSNNVLLGYGARSTSRTVSNEVTIGNGDITHFRIPGIGVSFSEGGAVVSGVVTATSFVGDGSALTGISGSGGVTVQDEGSALSTQASTLNFVGSGVVASGSGATKTITINAGTADTTNVRTNTLEVVGVSTFAGITTVTGNTLFTEQLGVSGVSTFANSVRISGALPDFTVDSGTFRYDNGKLFLLRSGVDARYYSGTPGGAKGPHVFYTHQGGSTVEMLRLNGDTGATLVGVMTATSFSGDGSALTGVNANVGITTNLSGSFTASAGSPATIDTFAYSSGDVVVEYTIYIQNGSSSQTQKLLASRLNANIDSTQFAVMYTSSLLVQCDATISGGNILLRATPESGVSGSTVYKVKREVM